MCTTFRTTKSPIVLFLTVCLSTLTACTGDNSKGSAGQNPDPVVLDIPIAYIKRDLPMEDADDDPATPDTPVVIDMQTPAAFNAGASLWIRDRAAPSAAERNITQRLVGVDPSFNIDDPDFLPDRYDVKDISPSWDGKRIVFALRAPTNPDFDEGEPGQATWDIWEYELETDRLIRVMRSDITAEAGEDVAPAYLPDGRIVFSSTRQRQAKAILLDEGKPQFSHVEETDTTEALLLHVMDADGTNIHQISFNQSHDLDASVMQDGRIVYTRWDNHPLMTDDNARQMHLYTINPDGSSAFVQKTYGGQTNRHAATLLYGNRSHAAGSNNDNDLPSDIQFMKPRQLQDGRMMTIIKPFSSTHYGGDIVAIDTTNYLNNVEPLSGQTGTGPAQNRMSQGDVQIAEDALVSPGGRFASAWPLWDGSGRLLVSWSQCRFIEGSDTTSPRIVPCTETNLTRFANQPETCAAPACVRLDEAQPLYGIYTYDISSKTQLPVQLPVEGQMITDVVAIANRALPQANLPPATDSDLVAGNVAVLHIRSVYDFDGFALNPATYRAATPTTVDTATLANVGVTTAAERPARFIRIEKAVSLPFDDDDRGFDYDAGLLGFFGNPSSMREILGYVPVEPDGSAKFQIPANVAISLQILDGMGRAIGPRHNNWLQFSAGEQVTCNGCHLPDGVPVDPTNPALGRRILPHGRGDAEAPTINVGFTGNGANMYFLNTQPTLDAQLGETMAEVWARKNGARKPSVHLIFNDDWTDPTVRTPDTGFFWSYNDFPPRQSEDGNTVPTSSGCALQWNSGCRITIHYLNHIQPIWNAGRPSGGADNRCINCHSPSDINGNVQVPAASLELTNEPDIDQADFVRSYAQLFNTRDLYQIVNGALVPIVVQFAAQQVAPVPNVNDPNILECAAPGIPDVPAAPTVCYVCPGGSPNDVTNPALCNETQTTGAPLIRNNSIASSTRFFNLFRAGGSHAGYLTDGELKLLTEWVDSGAQYYNDPFLAPQ